MFSCWNRATPPNQHHPTGLRTRRSFRPAPRKRSRRLSSLRMRSRPRAVRTAYLSKAGGGELFLFTGAISPAAAVVGRAGWPLLAVPGYGGGRSGSHDWNLSRHPARSPPAAPRPHPSSGGPRNFRLKVTSVLMLRDCGSPGA